ncbi:hypothetical protein [Bradyrhizobium sp. USDA 4504]
MSLADLVHPAFVGSGFGPDFAGTVTIWWNRRRRIRQRATFGRAYASFPIKVGISSANELTLRANRICGPSKVQVTVSRNADSTQVQVITNVRRSR